MAFDRESYKLNRPDTIQIFDDYLEQIAKGESGTWELNQTRAAILNLAHNELLMIQSSIVRWDTLMNDPELTFRRQLCLKLYNLTRTHIMEHLDLTSGAVSNIFNQSTMSNWPRPFQLSVLLNHPWQIVNKLVPDIFSYSESPEYFEDGVSKRIYLKDLADERAKVTSIRGYVIEDHQELFPEDSDPVTGRWVTTYPEFDYFEFHLNYEPLIDNVFRNGVLHFFPLARHIITTFRPCKSSKKRSLWVIIPKNETMNSYQGMLCELKEYRDHTEYHNLR